MLVRCMSICALPLLLTLTLPAWPDDPLKPAHLRFLAPAGAAVTVDGKGVGKETSLAIADLKPNEIRRLKVAVKFADGGEDEQLVDVQAGEQIPLPVPKSGKDKP